jgi:hypothetical protein
MGCRAFSEGQLATTQHQLLLTFTASRYERTFLGPAPAASTCSMAPHVLTYACITHHQPHFASMTKSRRCQEAPDSKHA